MARKDSRKKTHSRGFGDIIGIVLLALGLLLMASQVSFDKNDVVSNKVPSNETVNNWIGNVGAVAANGLFFLLGGGAFIVPLLLLVYGLACLFESWHFLKQRWPWALALFLASLGLFDLYSPHLTVLNSNINAPSTGGLFGQTLNNLVFRHFGVPGATIIFVTAYLISLLFLTNFRLSEWFAEFRVKLSELAEKRMEAQEKALAQKARELEKEAERLQKEVDKTELGADLQPIPEPTVRDHSVSGKRKKSKEGNEEEEEEEDLMDEGEVITAEDMDAEEPEPLPEPVVTIADQPVSKSRPPKKKKPITVAATPHIGDYELPPYEFLSYPDSNSKPTDSKSGLMSNARLMQNTLAQFGIEVALGDITKGPTITRYELHPAPGVKLEKISGLTNNIAAALKAERINILAPVPGKSSVGIEVPNLVKTKVIMRDLFESDEWKKSKARIPLALGKDVYGKPIIADLAEMPHLLIAGSTGSGKSVCINSIIASLLFKFGPDDLRFVMIDPKVVELQAYNSLPHLVVPVVNDPKKVILALRWVVNEMEKRYQIFAKVGVRNVKSFNSRPLGKKAPEPEPELPLTVTKENVEAGEEGFAVELDEEIVVPREDDIVIPEKLSYIVVIIDELADLMLVAPADVEMAIARITQMARAAGIHCIVATQRPSVDVITGVIKANIPARIAFQVAAKVDSRTILDSMGADKLLGKGDMLYLPPGSAKLIRVQGALITDEESETIVQHIASQGKPSYEAEIHQQLSKPTPSIESNTSDEDEELIEKCMEVIRTEQRASVSLIQRRLRLGYTRAARIMDELEDRGVVGPSRGAEPREILIDLDVAAQ